jgi:transcriptional regulator with XRE-family HTH domain
VTDARYTYTAGMPAERVGWLMARARTTAGATERDVAMAAGVSARVVRRWERGGGVPTDDQVEAIAAACGTRLTELLPRRAAASFDPLTGALSVGEHAATVPASGIDNDAVLRAYVVMVRRQRGLRESDDVRLRQDDLDALAEALDLDDDDLEDRLVRLIGLSRSHAAAVRAQLLRRRLAVPVVSVLTGLALFSLSTIFGAPSSRLKAVDETTVPSTAARNHDGDETDGLRPVTHGAGRPVQPARTQPTPPPTMHPVPTMLTPDVHPGKAVAAVAAGVPAALPNTTAPSTAARSATARTTATRRPVAPTPATVTAVTSSRPTTPVVSTRPPPTRRTTPPPVTSSPPTATTGPPATTTTPTPPPITTTTTSTTAMVSSSAPPTTEELITTTNPPSSSSSAAVSSIVVAGP